MSATDSMVERVALAIYTAAHPDDTWSDRTDLAQNHYRALARAAIEAMHEPTEAQLHAMTMLAPTWDNAVSLAKWKAGIDAAEQTQAPEPRGEAHPNHGAP